jgi:hypothetical protein
LPPSGRAENLRAKKPVFCKKTGFSHFSATEKPGFSKETWFFIRVTDSLFTKVTEGAEIFS